MSKDIQKVKFKLLKNKIEVLSNKVDIAINELTEKVQAISVEMDTMRNLFTTVEEAPSNISIPEQTQQIVIPETGVISFGKLAYYLNCDIFEILRLLPNDAKIVVINGALESSLLNIKDLLMSSETCLDIKNALKENMPTEIETVETPVEAASEITKTPEIVETPKVVEAPVETIPETTENLKTAEMPKTTKVKSNKNIK